MCGGWVACESARFRRPRTPIAIEAQVNDRRGCFIRNPVSELSQRTGSSLTVEFSQMALRGMTQELQGARQLASPGGCRDEPGTAEGRQHEREEKPLTVGGGDGVRRSSWGSSKEASPGSPYRRIEQKVLSAEGAGFGGPTWLQLSALFWR